MLLRKQATVEQLNVQELPTDDEITPQAVMSVAMQAGVILLSSGAETFRVENTTMRILSLSGSDEYDANAMGTSLIATLISPDNGQPFTRVCRVSERSLNLLRIAEVNQLSRDLAEHKLTFKQAAAKMNQLSKPAYAPWQKNLAILVMISSFVALLSGRLIDAIGSLPIAVGIILVNILVRYIRIEGFVANFLSAFMTASVAVITQRYFITGAALDALVAGALMPLLPGTSFTNAIRDVIAGDYISAAARGLEAILIALALALGVGLAIILFGAYL